ncbi:MAG TPA: sulfate ABC transporter permease subunit CysW [Caulobacteraceae bacterium]|nr:sulfate ABC transporter permease subunit CysW [Caulobacteraceae bacterium]
MIAGAVRRPLSGPGPWLLAAGALAWLALVIGAPLAVVFAQAVAKGVGPFLDAFKDPDCQAAIRLTLLVAAIAVPLNAAFGLAAAWSIARFEFRGRAFLLTLIDLPLSLSPVISGLVWVLLFGSRGWFGPELDAAGIKIVFALPGLVLGTILVTVPLVARQLIPLMIEQGADEELAAVTLGSGGWTMLRKVTLPNVRYALLHGVLLTNARAMGEFGAVSVLSGHIRGLTETLPLHVEAVYNDYDFVGAFAAASLLAGLAIVTLIAKAALERTAMARTAS